MEFELSLFWAREEHIKDQSSFLTGFNLFVFLYTGELHEKERLH